MTLETARSIELERDITAEEADKLFQKRTITSKHLFECPDDNCHAQVTCANLDKPRGLRKRDPYFKFVSEHSPGCFHEAEADEDLRRVKNLREDPEALPYIRDDIIDLDLSTPFKRNVNEIAVPEDEQGGKKRNRITTVEETENSKRRHAKKRLSGLANAFIAGEDFFLNTADGKLHLKDFFIRISDRKDLMEYPDEPRVYYGKAWLNAKKDYFLVRFNAEMKTGDVKSKPTFFIPARLIDSSSYRRTSREKLDAIANATPSKPLHVFIFSELPPVKSIKENYINFKLDDLSHLYFLPWSK